MKYIKLVFTIFICFILCGCFLDDPKYITFETKPTTYYYSDELYSKLKENPSFTLQDVYKRQVRFILKKLI